MANLCCRSLLLACCFLLLLPAARAQQVVEVITLGYRQAEEVIPIVRPLLAPGGTVTGINNRLVVKTTSPKRLLNNNIYNLDASELTSLLSVR